MIIGLIGVEEMGLIGVGVDNCFKGIDVDAVRGTEGEGVGFDAKQPIFSFFFKFQVVFKEVDINTQEHFKF